MFFPQLVAGPIERPQNLLSQIHKEQNFDFDRMVSGLLLIGWGLFKKSVIADRLAIIVNPVFNAPAGFEGIPLVCATVFFGFQIYCDFSGYSDIAIGSAEILGFKLMKNFKQPYCSKSVVEFWRRWHISLSTWFRDYFYIPMGGNKLSRGRWCFAIMTVFLVSGLWHGANWTFVIWGALHGCYMVIGGLSKKTREALARHMGLMEHSVLRAIAQITVTFCLVTFAWIFFRSNNVSDAWYIVSHLFTGWGHNINSIIENRNDARSAVLYLGQTKGTFFFFITAIISLMTVQWKQQQTSIRMIILNYPIWVRWGLYYLLISAILIVGVFHKTEFIYFQF
jgi:Predicted membrane protein involved in D-alanine export